MLEAPASVMAVPPVTVGVYEDATTLLLGLYELAGAVLGLFIAYLAYRGYRRNDSRPMLFIAVGFGIILGLPIPVFLLTLVARSLPEQALQFVVQTLEIVGLLCIVYALRMDA